MKTRLLHCLLLALIAAGTAYGIQHFVMAGDVNPHLVYIAAGGGAIIGLLFGHGLSDALKSIISLR